MSRKKFIPIFLKVLYKVCPPARPYIKIVGKVDRGLDKVSDRARKSRTGLVNRIIKRHSVVIGFFFLFLVAGCQTVNDLRADGYKVTRWQATELNVLDTVIGADDVVDYLLGE
jgi:hypothetical protein